MDVSLDLVLNSEDSAPISAVAWLALVRIVPDAGAVGSVAFNPPDSINNEPNLRPAASEPFADFDRDFGGMAYGGPSPDGQSISAFAAYVPPVVAPVPALDQFGNLTVPDGAGLASLPLHVAPGTSGTFLLEFDAAPQLNGVIYRAAEPNPMRLHPVTAHVTGMLTVELVMPVAGDTNGDGVIDVDDLNNVRNNFGTQGPDDGTLPGDADPFDGMVDIDDLNAVRNNFGTGATAVPEPSACNLAALCVAGLIARRRRGPHHSADADR